MLAVGFVYVIIVKFIWQAGNLLPGTLADTLKTELFYGIEI